MTVTTCARGRAALADVDDVRVVPLDAAAEVMWRRHGMTGGDVTRALAAAPDLRWVHTDTAGVDELPLADLAARGVVVTKTSAYTEAVAEWIVTAVCMAAKSAAAYVRASDAREWQPAVPMPRLVSGSRALIIGSGEIGTRAGNILDFMGVRVDYASRRSRPSWRLTLGAVDWLILACPLTEQTRGLVGPALLAALKSGAWVVNVARGGILDEGALAARLEEGWLGGAVLDTFDVEPLPQTSPLWGRADVIVLPHDAWRARGAGRRQVDDFVEQLHRYRAGQPLRREVDTAAGY